MSQNNGKPRKAVRQKVASDLSDARKQRSNKEQLKLLDERLGKGVGAKKERKRLSA